MGALAEDTAVEQVDDGRYVARLSKDWEIWGPMGGYVAAVALRAAGAASPFERPASFNCHYLGVARFDEVQLTIVPTRVGRGTASQRVVVAQGDRPIMEANVWSIPAGTPGLEHDESGLPDGVPGPDETLTIAELLGDDAPPPFPFWRNFTQKPLQFQKEWPPPGPLEAVWRSWLRFEPWTPTADPWLAAARLVLLADLPSWPSGHRAHAHREHGFYAPTLDLQVSLLDLAADEPWLLLEGTSPVAADGLMAFTSRLWTPAGRLVATGGGQTLFRSMPGS
jgi:acyl-CoA thioesterase-2